MSNLDAYLKKRGITEQQMQEAREDTQVLIDAHTLREARKAAHLMQAEVAEDMFAGWTGSYQPPADWDTQGNEIDWGEPVGDESLW